MYVTTSAAGLNTTINQAREQLRLFIIKNELERLAANRMDVLRIRATAKTTGRILDTGEPEAEEQLTWSGEGLNGAIEGVRTNYASSSNHGVGHGSAHGEHRG